MGAKKASSKANGFVEKGEHISNKMLSLRLHYLRHFIHTYSISRICFKILLDFKPFELLILP